MGGEQHGPPWWKRILKNPWFIRIVSGVLLILIGRYLVPCVEYKLSQPEVEIVYPISGEVVYWHEKGSTVVGNYWKLQHNQIYVLLHPTDTTWWYVQGQATLLNENMWRAKVYYGTKPDEVGSFDILALMTTRKLTSGEKYDLGDLKELERESDAHSNVVTVTKSMLEECKEIPKTGTIHVTSNPSGASFSLSGPADYGGTTPWRKTEAPVGNYTITWGSMSGYETLFSESGALTKDGTMFFHGIYLSIPTYRLTINTSGQGGTDPSQGTRTYDEGTPVTITATPASGCSFDHWGGDASGIDPSVTITMNSNKSVTAYFSQLPPTRYTLTINISGQGSTSPTQGSHTYDEGTRVTVNATPASGCSFDHWGGDASGIDPSVTITMNSNKSITAYFTTVQYTLSTSVNPSGSGSVSPSSDTYNAGTSVTLTAIPAPGYSFDHWGGDVSGSSTTITIAMDEDKDVVAYFIGKYTRECEYPDENTVGKMIWRSDASGSRVHGQFGCESFDPWTGKAGYVKYNAIELQSSDHIYLVLRYSKNSTSTTPIKIYLDEEREPRATFIPENQGSWDRFAETQPIDLGQITVGTHTITFSTDGQQYGVADLDKFTLSYLNE